MLFVERQKEGEMPISDQGVDVSRFMLIPRTLIFLFRGDMVLLLKGSANKKLWAGKYNGLGGHVEAGESILQAAYRELYEETGLSEPLHLSGTIIISNGSNPGILLFVFQGKTDQLTFRATHEGTAEWIRLEAIDQFPIVEDLVHILPAVITSTQTRQTFSAISKYDINGNPQLFFDEVE
jgi:8-oxo-dGTP diphosphatase